MSFAQILENIWTWIITEGLKVVVGLIVFFILCKIINIITKKFSAFLIKKKVDEPTAMSIGNFCRKALKTLLFLGFLTLIGVQTSTISAAIASVGLTLGLALQGSLSNFAGGVVIMVMRPYKVGDMVECAGQIGTVEKIELFYTYLVTADNKAIMLPNSSVANTQIVNYSAKHNRRLDLDFTIDYKADYAKAKEVILDCVKESHLALTDPAPTVNISKHADSSIVVTAKVWVNTPDYFVLRTYLLEEVKLAFDRNDVNIPYPQLDVHIKKDD